MRSPEAAKATTFSLRDATWVVMEGEFDRPDVDRIRAGVVTAAGTTRRLVLDMRGVSFFGAAAIGLVGDARRARTATIDVLVPAGARRLLQLCGLGPPRLRYWSDAETLLGTLSPAAPDLEPILAGPGTAEALACSYQTLSERFQQLDARRRLAFERSRALRDAPA